MSVAKGLRCQDFCFTFCLEPKVEHSCAAGSSSHPENTWSAVTMKPYICSSVSSTHCCPESINSGIPRDQHPNLTPCACPLVSQNKSTYCCVRFWPKLGRRTNLKFSFKTWIFKAMNVQSARPYGSSVPCPPELEIRLLFPRVAVEQDNLGGLIVGFVF